MRNVAIEIEYNIKLLTKVRDGLNECIDQVTIGDRNSYCNVNYSRFAHFLLMQYYQSGFMSEKWSIDKIDKIDDIFISYTQGADTYILDTLDKWRGN